MTLLEAWNHWAHLELKPTSILWGHQLVWWARAGKLAQATGSLTIVAELIGSERLREFGNSLHGKLTVRSAFLYTKYCLTWLIRVVKALFWGKAMGNIFKQKRENAGNQEVVTHFYLSISYLSTLTLALIFYFYQIAAEIFNLPMRYDAGNNGSTALQILMYLSAIVIGLIFIIFILTGIVIDLLLVEPIAWIIERPRFDRWLKIAALILLIVGFHFDFLAS